MIVLRSADAKKVAGKARSCDGSCSCGGKSKHHTVVRRAMVHPPQPPRPHVMVMGGTPQDPLLHAIEALRREIEGLRRDIHARHGAGCPNCQAKAPAAPQSRRIMLRTTPGKTPPQIGVGMAPGGAIAVGRAPASREIAELRKQLAETKAAIKMLMKRIAVLEEKSR
jgi:hypothetical protein